MALPPSGQICFSQVRSEFGYSGQVCMSTFFNNRYTCRGGGYCLSNWRGYDHAPCSSNVTITFHVPSTAVCWSAYNFAASSSETLLTGVTVTYTWYGDLGGFMSGSLTIPQGTSCNSGGFGNVQVSCWGENYSTNVVNINPTSFGSQNYIEGNTFTSGIYPC